MANDNAGVQIPVIIDIDKACKDAAARVEQAMKPLQRQIENNALNIKVQFGRGDDSYTKSIRQLQSDFKKGELSAVELSSAIEQVNDRLAKLALSGRTDSTKFKNLLQAKFYLEDMLAATERVRTGIDGMANSMNGLNARLQASRIALQSSALDSPEWKQAAKDIRAITDEMAKWEQKMQTLGMKSGSIEKMRAEITAIEQKWNALSRTQRDGSAGQKVLQQYRQITAEIEKEGKSLSQIIAEEQKRAQLAQRGAQSRKFEQWSLQNLATTMAGLQRQAQTLQRIMDTTVPHSDRWNQAAAQLRVVNSEIDKLSVGHTKVKSSIDATNASMTKQSALWSQLRGLAGMYLSVFGGLRLAKNIRETTAEFELQRVALGAVIQDTQKATSLFKQLKAAALESPFEIKDLVTYTKQLAAYQIETDKLFDTTKRLADVSAGLGVDMGRLILAYGQVRAASVLRGQELRQFTEAGVPLVDKLAEKFSQLRGEMVSTGEVFELISKRAVPFSMISEIFEDMTEKGGIFYDMQKKQSETLYGQWQKLKDAASIMYDEIGNTSFVRKGMEGIMSLTMNLLRNWEGIATVLRSVALGYGFLKVASAFLPTLTRNTVLYQKAVASAAKAEIIRDRARQSGSSILRNYANSLVAVTKHLRAAATATTIWGRSWHRIMASMAGGGWTTLLVTALTTVIGLITTIDSKTEKLNKELAKIGTDATAKSEQSIRNFTRLADAATDSSKGLAAQQKAVEELRRTYGDIIPSQKLQIDYLQNMKGKYDELTQAIRENIQMEAKKQKLDAITDAFGAQMNRKERQIRSELMGEYGFSEEEVEASLIALRNAIDKGLFDVNATVEERSEQFRALMKDTFGRTFGPLYTRTGYGDVVESRILDLFTGYALRLANLKKETDKLDDSTAQLIATTGIYAKDIEEMEKRVAAIPDKLIDEGFKKESFEFALQSQLRSVEEWKNSLSKIFGGADISDAFNLDGRINFDVLYKKLEDAEPQAKAVVDRIKKAYEQLIPTDNFVAGIQEQFIKIAESFGVSMDDLQTNLMQSGDSIEGYIKKLKESSKGYEDSINKMNHANAQFAAGITVFGFYSDEQVKNVQNLKAVIDEMLKALEAFDTKTKTPGTSGSSYQKPKFITNMEEAIKFMQDFKKGYDDLRKYMGSEGALGKEAEIMLGRGLGLGIDAQEQKKAAENLSEWYQEMIDKTMAEMKKRGARGATVTDLLGFDAGKNKALRDFQKLLQSLFDAKTDLDTTNWKNSLEKALNDLAEKVKHGEAAKKFYDSIFEMTGDKEMAMNMAISVYGDAGQDVAKNIQEQMSKAFVLDPKLIEDAGESYGDIALAVEKAISAGNYGELEKYLQFVTAQNRAAAAAVVKDWQKTGEDTAKNFAKLALKFDELEQQRVNITNKAAKERESVEKGLAQELIGINAYYNKKIDEAEDAAEIERLAKAKDAAIAEAKARADALKQGITNEEQYELSKLTREYRLFFSTVGVLSKESARKVYEEARKMLNKQFESEQKTLDEYRKELKALDEQYKKYGQSQNLFVNYLTGGINGALNKIKDYEEGLQGLVNTMEKNKEDGTAIFGENDEKFINMLGLIFGGKIFGVSGRRNVFQKLLKKTGGDAEEMKDAFNKAGEAISAWGANMSRGLAVADIWVSVIGNLIIELDKLANQGEETAKWFDGLANAVFWTSGFNWLAGGKVKDAGDRLADMNEHAMKGFQKFQSGDVGGALVETIESWAAVWGPSMRTINREIKKQQQLIDELSYQYGRLDVAIDKAFGESYIYNYNKQLENLAAQQQAYLRQAELERSKGKKKDKDKIKEYEDAARSTADKIADMQSQLSEFFAGTDLTSAAEDFATAWIEAYAEFANTTDAMRDKFEEMIKSMITRSLAAKLMQSILQPLFDQIDAMAKDGDLSAYEISEIARQAPEYVAKMNEAMTTMANDLSAAGYNLRGTTTNLTGISRDIAGASEESILGLSAAINTQNFYISRIPSIDEKMSQIIALMGGNVAQGGAPQAETPETDLKLQYLSYLPTMASDVNEILVNLKRVISPKGASTATHYIAMR